MSKHSSLSNSPWVSDWLDFSHEGELILHTGKVDIGQRITTALALIAAEELSIPFDDITVRKTRTDVDPNEGYTAGSFSMQHSGYAIKKAKLESLVNYLSDGVETFIGEKGIRLSGGERQRVPLARAFYHGRDFLIMDEATSALDSNTEEKIVNEIKSLKKKVTTIVIAHRLSTIKHCDHIFEIKDGRVTQHKG